MGKGSGGDFQDCGALDLSLAFARSIIFSRPQSDLNY